MVMASENSLGETSTFTYSESHFIERFIVLYLSFFREERASPFSQIGIAAVFLGLARRKQAAAKWDYSATSHRCQPY